MHSEALWTVLLVLSWATLAIALCVVLLQRSIKRLKLAVPNWPPNGGILFIAALGFSGYSNAQCAELTAAGGKDLVAAFSRERLRCVRSIAILEIVLFLFVFWVIVPLVGQIVQSK